MAQTQSSPCNINPNIINGRPLGNNPQPLHFQSKAEDIRTAASPICQPHFRQSPEEDLYYVDMKIVSHSKEILDQIAQSLTETKEYVPKQSDQYSFSRVLDPLEIYDNNIKPNTKVDYHLLEEQLSSVIDESFSVVKKTISKKYQDMEQEENPEVNSGEMTSAEFKQFLERERKGVSAMKNSLDFEVIDEESEEDNNQSSQSLLGLSRILPMKMSLETSSSKSMISYLRRIVKGPSMNVIK